MKKIYTVVLVLGCFGGSLCAMEEPELSPLHQAAQAGSFANVDLLLLSGTDIEEQNQHGESALHVAVDHGKIDMVRALIWYGAEVDLRSDLLETPLHYACTAEMAQCLITSGAGTDVQNVNGHTPLHTAVYFKQHELAYFLIRCGINQRLVDYAGLTAVEFLKQNLDDFNQCFCELVGVGEPCICKNVAWRRDCLREWASIFPELQENDECSDLEDRLPLDSD